MQCADKTITLYNVLYDADNGTDIYKRTVLNGVSWFGRAKTTVAGDGGLLAADEHTVRIPAKISGYVDPKACTGETDTWTLQASDIIVKGEAGEITTPKELFEAHNEIMTVLSVTDNRGGRGGHFKVVGK